MYMYTKMQPSTTEGIVKNIRVLDKKDNSWSFGGGQEQKGVSIYISCTVQIKINAPRLCILQDISSCKKPFCKIFFYCTSRLVKNRTNYSLFNRKKKQNYRKMSSILESIQHVTELIEHTFLNVNFII